jgi:hypothetical protein
VKIDKGDTAPAIESVPAVSTDPMERFRTRERAIIPYRMFLVDPGTSQETTEYIDIVSSLSDTFKEASDDAMQKAGALASEQDANAKRDKLKTIQVELQAALVVAWSFPQACTRANVATFLVDAPQVARMVGVVADKAELFFGNALPR